MKKLAIISLLILGGLNMNAQQHEAKIDVLDLVAFKSLDVTYQYLLNEESAAGLSLYVPLSDNNNIFSHKVKFTITPFYRQYFPLGAVENIFAEAFFAVNSGTFEESINDGTGNTITSKIDYTDGAFGFAVGKAYVSPRGFVAEAFVGAGRNLFDTKGSPSFVPRIGINLGYRF